MHKGQHQCFWKFVPQLCRLLSIWQNFKKRWSKTVHCILHSFLIMKFSLYFSPNVSPNDTFIASNFSPDEFGLCYILCHCIVLYSSMTLIRHFLNKKSIWRRQWVIFNIQMKAAEANSVQFHLFFPHYHLHLNVENDSLLVQEMPYQSHVRILHYTVT